MLSGLSFQAPWALWLALLGPLSLLWRWRRRRRGSARASLLFPGASAFKASGPARGSRVKLLPLLPWARAIVLILAAVALARPQTRDARAQKLAVEGIDIVLALDLSTSMEAGDFRPNNRLYVAKEVLTEFLDSRVNDRVGLVVFAGGAYTQAPLTLDYGVLKDVVQRLKTRVLEDGTAIGDALAVSLNRLRDSEAKSRVVVLITDGDNNAGRISPLDAAEMGKKLHIPVFSILVGKGGQVPFPAGTDLFGNTVWREMEIPTNPALLKQISQSTGGEYYRATDRKELKAGLDRVLGAMERSKIMEGGAAARMTEQYFPFLVVAVALGLVELLSRATWLRVRP